MASPTYQVIGVGLVSVPSIFSEGSWGSIFSLCRILSLTFVIKEHMSHSDLPFLLPDVRAGDVVLKHKHWPFSWYVLCLIAPLPPEYFQAVLCGE